MASNSPASEVSPRGTSRPVDYVDAAVLPQGVVGRDVTRAVVLEPVGQASDLVPAARVAIQIDFAHRLQGTVVPPPGVDGADRVSGRDQLE